MSNAVIKVENLSKSYILQHQNKEKYVALRDVIAGGFKSIISPRLKSGKPSSEEFWALNDISFEINQGERIGIIGRNGAGKSTLLKVLSRIVSPTKGRITLEGRVASLLEVGTGFHPELTGRENIFLNGSILGMSKSEIKNKFDEIVAFSEIEKFLDTPVKRYSSGMYVRLAFAVAAHLEPEILIVDEVLAVGDAQFQKKCLGKMEDVSKDGRTVLFVSHNMAAVASLCTNAILLDKGSIYDMGGTDRVMKSYLQIGKKNTGDTRDDELAPSYAKLKIRSARILNKELLSVPELNNGDTGFIEVGFEVVQAGRDYDVAIHLNHLKYGVIFTSSLKDSDRVNNNGRVFEKGTYTYIMELPMRILREGDYSIAVTSAIPNVEALDVFKYEIPFYIFDTISSVATLTEGRPGAILPVIEWKRI